MQGGRQAQTGAREGQVQIARIAQEGLFLDREQRGQTLARHGKQRSHEAAARQFAHGRHAGQSLDAAAGAAADQMRFDLILEMMRRKQVQAEAAAAPRRQQAVTCLPRPLLDAALRLRSNPAQDIVRNPTGAEP